ncbi:SnoaL-like polyketide cyclase [Aquimixticola soesokkakensis]|uniref:SnoaL-like polyketide cyclase n=1 Tax=Aquimixticola soesokkakensis TaxID=1519096 RepID=A0A1Y5SM63_9RHOB|nr:ester cyclase [Aquimixticola soesokkakensis]SLN42240.1 SnoaL-like polyketide cyclase [Aquimixticola soesokkakensis]
MEYQQLLQSWYDRVWSQGDLDAVDEFFAPQAAANGMMPDLQASAADMRDLVLAVQSMLREIKFSVDLVLVQDDWVSAMVSMAAKSAETMQPVKINGHVMMRMEGGLIVEAYNHFDFLGFLEQVGALPKDTLALALSGMRFS